MLVLELVEEKMVPSLFQAREKEGKRNGKKIDP